MVNCKDGRKRVIVKEYEKKDRTEVSSHKPGCPTRKSNTADNSYICCVCGEEHGFERVDKYGYIKWLKVSEVEELTEVITEHKK